MKKTPLLFVVAAFLVAGVAQAQNAILDYQGYAWESGGFPPSAADDMLNIVGVVDALDARFGINLLTDEVTLWVTSLISTGQVDLGGGILMVAYSGGEIELWQDPSQDRDFGINPPNSTAPATFVNGTLLLGGTLSDFFLFLDLTSGVGGYEGNAFFASGTGLATLNLIDADGYTFGGVLTPAASGGNVPQGYDLQVDGVLEVRVPVGVEKTNWGAIKDLYRR